MNDFITGAELLKRWAYEDWQLLQIIKTKRLPPYDKATLLEIEIDPSIKYYVSGGGGRQQFTSEEILPILHNCLFRQAHVDLIEGQNPKSTTQSAEEYIKAARGKIRDEIIALELKERYGWALLQIARRFKLDDDLQPNQIDTLKQRGKRFCEKGEKLKMTGVTNRDNIVTTIP